MQSPTTGLQRQFCGQEMFSWFVLFLQPMFKAKLLLKCLD